MGIYIYITKAFVAKDGFELLAIGFTCKEIAHLRALPISAVISRLSGTRPRLRRPLNCSEQKGQAAACMAEPCSRAGREWEEPGDLLYPK